MNEQRTFWSAIVTMVMWIALTVISLAFMALMNPGAIGAAIFVIVMAGMAIGGTAIIWDNVNSQPPVVSSARQKRATRKAKRADRDRAARLIEDLDDDQLIELETLLLAGQEGWPDGEQLQ